MYRRLGYPYPPDFVSVRFFRAYCLLADLIINNSFVFRHRLSGHNVHSVVESGLDLFFVARSWLNSTTESLSGPSQACVLEIVGKGELIEETVPQRLKPH